MVTYGSCYFSFFIVDFFLVLESTNSLGAYRFYPTLSNSFLPLLGVASDDGTILFSFVHSLNDLNCDLFAIVISASSFFYTAFTSRFCIKDVSVICPF